MRHVAPIRRELGVRTVFNLLGPLTNPAGARRQVLGVYAENLVEPIAQVLVALGAERAMVVHGFGGLDELTPTGENVVAEVRDGAGARCRRSTRGRLAPTRSPGVRTTCGWAAIQPRTRPSSPPSSTASAARVATP